MLCFWAFLRWNFHSLFSCSCCCFTKQNVRRVMVRSPPRATLSSWFSTDFRKVACIVSSPKDQNTKANVCDVTGARRCLKTRISTRRDEWARFRQPWRPLSQSDRERRSRSCRIPLTSLSWKWGYKRRRCGVLRDSGRDEPERWNCGRFRRWDNRGYVNEKNDCILVRDDCM